MGDPAEPAEASGLHPRLLKSSQELGAGLFVIAIAGFALWQAAPLDSGTLRAFGPGMLPKALAVCR